jgi:ATP-dependent Clp protease ATP-binding subunit ClpC
MTTNIGADVIKRQSTLGFALKKDEVVEERLAYEDMRKKLIDSLRRVFRPEFVNRLDSVIVFRSLNKDDIKQIVELELNKVVQRLEEHEIILKATPEALEKLADLGYDPEMGARPLRRVIQQKVEDPLSDSLLAGDFDDCEMILVELENDEIVLKRGEIAQEEKPSPPQDEAVVAA